MACGPKDTVPTMALTYTIQLLYDCSSIAQLYFIYSWFVVGVLQGSNTSGFNFIHSFVKRSEITCLPPTTTPQVL